MSLDKTDALWAFLKLGLLASGWTEEKEDTLLKRYQTGVGEQFDEVVFRKGQCFEPTQYGYGRELLLFTKCDENFCNNWYHFVWKINADDGLFKRWKHNGQMFWLIWESTDAGEFQSDFEARIAEADAERTRYERFH